MEDHTPASHLLPALAGRAQPCPAPPFTRASALKVAWGRQWAGSLCSALDPKVSEEPRSPSESTGGGKGAPGGYGRGWSCHHGAFSLGFAWVSHPPSWGSPKTGLVCTWRGKASSPQLGDDAETEKPQVGKKCDPALLLASGLGWVSRGISSVSHPHFWPDLVERTTGQVGYSRAQNGGCLHSTYCVQGWGKQRSPPSKPKQKPQRVPNGLPDGSPWP